MAEPVAPAVPAAGGGLSFVELARFHYREGGLVQVTKHAMTKAQRLARQVALGKDRPA